MERRLRAKVHGDTVDLRAPIELNEGDAPGTKTLANGRAGSCSAGKRRRGNGNGNGNVNGNGVTEGRRSADF